MDCNEHVQVLGLLTAPGKGPRRVKGGLQQTNGFAAEYNVAPAFNCLQSNQDVQGAYWRPNAQSLGLVLSFNVLWNDNIWSGMGFILELG